MRPQEKGEIRHRRNKTIKIRKKYILRKFTIIILRKANEFLFINVSIMRKEKKIDFF